MLIFFWECGLEQVCLFIHVKKYICWESDAQFWFKHKPKLSRMHYLLPFKKFPIRTSYYPLKSLISQALIQRAEEIKEYIFFHLLTGELPSRAYKLALLLCFSPSLATGHKAEKCWQSVDPGLPPLLWWLVRWSGRDLKIFTLIPGRGSYS